MSKINYMMLKHRKRSSIRLFGGEIFLILNPGEMKNCEKVNQHPLVRFECEEKSTLEEETGTKSIKSNKIQPAVSSFIPHKL